MSYLSDSGVLKQKNSKTWQCVTAELYFNLKQQTDPLQVTSHSSESVALHPGGRENSSKASKKQTAGSFILLLFG